MRQKQYSRTSIRPTISSPLCAGSRAGLENRPVASPETVSAAHWPHKEQRKHKTLRNASLGLQPKESRHSRLVSHRLYLAKNAPLANSQEERIRCQHVSGDHWRGQKDSCNSEKRINIFARRRGGRGFLRPKRQSAAHGRIQDRQGSNDCDRRPGKLLR